MEYTTTELGDGRVALRFEARYGHPPEKVWRAITEVGQLRTWFVEILDYDRSRLEFAPGAALVYVAKGAEQPVGHGQVTVFEPPRQLEYTWDAEVLRWELTPDGNGCRVVFTNVVDGPETAAAVAPGWADGLRALGRAIA